MELLFDAHVKLKTLAKIKSSSWFGEVKWKLKTYISDFGGADFWVDSKWD